jgi:hypothetical protein
VERIGRRVANRGQIGYFIENGDEVVCDLLSDDIWIFVKYNFQCKHKQRDVTVELKVEKTCTIANLLLSLQKLAMNVWSYINSRNPKYYYVLKKFKAKLVKVSKEEKGDISLDTSGVMVNDLIKLKHVAEVFTSNSAFVIKVEVLTVEEELALNPTHALKAFDNKKHIICFSEIEASENRVNENTTLRQSLRNSQLFGPDSKIINKNRGSKAQHIIWTICSW